MSGNCDSCAHLAFIIVAFVLALRQGDCCDMTARPHPEGICGEKLTIAHQNLCYLLRNAFPHLFPTQKRSQTPALPPSTLLSSRSSPYYLTPIEENRSRNGLVRVRRDAAILERIYSIPLDRLATLHLTEDNWRSFVYKRAGGQASTVTGLNLEFSENDLDMIDNGQTKSLLRMLASKNHKRSRISKRNSEGLVCECCINRCLPRQLGTYC